MATLSRTDPLILYSYSREAVKLGVIEEIDPDMPGLEITLNPVRVVGTLRVEEQREDELLLALFRLEDAEGEELRY